MTKGEVPQGPSPDREIDSAEFVEKLFLIGSRRFSASTVAQALFYAAECQEAQVQPGDVVKALQADSDRLTKLAGVVNSVHEAVRKKRAKRNKLFSFIFPDNPPPEDVTPEDVSENIGMSFGIAQGLMGYPLNDLRELFRLYPRLLRPGGDPEKDLILVKGRLDRMESRRRPMHAKPWRRKIRRKSFEDQSI